MSRSFSVEDLLDEVEKICYDASGTSKVIKTSLLPFTPHSTICLFSLFCEVLVAS